MPDSGFHRDNVGLDVHVPHTFTYATEALRAAAVSADFIDPDDLRKHAYQESDDTIWVLIAITPSVVWKALGSEAGASELPFTSVTDPAVDAAVTTAIIDLNSGTVITLTAAGNSQTLGAPSDTTAGRKFFVVNNDTSADAIIINGTSLSSGRYIELRWDGDAWILTSGGVVGGVGGSNTEIQYNKTGTIAGDPKLTWDDVNKKQTILGDIEQVRGTSTNPYTPVVISTTAVGANPRNSTVLGSNLYVVDQTDEDVKIYDVTDPAVPGLLGSIGGLEGCRGVDIAGDTAYVSAQSPNTLSLINIGNKSTPTIKSSLVLPAGGSQRGVRVRGATVFTTNNGAAQAFSSIDVTNPDNPILLDTLALSAGPRTEFDVSGGVAFLSFAGASNNFQLIDVSDPTNMSLLVSLDIGVTIWAAKVQGPYAYVVGESNPSFQIFDVSDPAATTNVAVGSLNLTPTSPRALDVSGNFAYVVDASNNTAQVIDISDPTTPVLIGTVAIGQNPVSIRTVGRFGYITDNTDDNFKVVDFGGIQAQNLNVGNADVGDLNVRRDVKAAGLISAAAAVFGVEGVNSEGHVRAKGRIVGGLSKNLVEIYSENNFPISAGHIILQPGVTYEVMAPITITNQITHPVTVSGFDPAVIRTNAKYKNIISVNLAVPLLDSLAHSGQLTFENCRLENIGTGSFAVISGLTQISLLTELTHSDVVGFADGSIFTTCGFNVNDRSFWSGSGTPVFIDCELNVSDHFTANFVDNGDSSFDLRSSAGSSQPSFANFSNLILSSQANEAFFMLHSNLIAGSIVRINGIDQSRFTPGTGSFYATLSGLITALLDSGEAPGVRTICISAGHRIADGDTVIHIGFTSAPALNGTFVASNVTATQYEVVAVFSVTDTGTWVNNSLTEQSTLVTAFNNPGQPESTVTGEAFLIGNVTQTDIPLVDAKVIITVSGWTTMQLAKITVSDTGRTAYIGVNDISLLVDGSISIEPAVATKSLSVQAAGIHISTLTVVTFTNATNLINDTATTLVDGETISFLLTAGTLPAELRTDILYYIINKNANDFQVAYTAGGTAITFTDDGSGTNSYVESIIHGSSPSASIGAGSPTVLAPKALIPVSLNDEVILVVSNHDDAVNILVSSAYNRVVRV